MPVLFDTIIPLYSYCEQTGGALTQPLNFLSCIAFWLAGLWMWHTQEDDGESPNFHQVSAILLFLLGISGMLWHAGGWPWAQAVDMLMMSMLFVIIAVTVVNDILRWPLGKGLAVTVALIFISAFFTNDAIAMLPQNGGLFAPLLFFLAIAALKVQPLSEEVTVYMLSAAYTLFFGLLARSADNFLCGYAPQGLHFLWHVFLAISVIYIGKTVITMKEVPWPGETAAKTET